MELLLSYYVLRYTSVQSCVAVIVILGQPYTKEFEAESVGVVSVSPSPSRLLVVSVVHTSR